MSAYTALDPWRLPGFSRLAPPPDIRLRQALETEEPLSDEGDSLKLVVVRNITVLIRMLLWYRDIRGGGDLLSEAVSESMGGPFTRLRVKLRAFWGHLLAARQEWLRARLPGPTVVQAAGGAVSSSGSSGRAPSSRGPYFARRGGASIGDNSLRRAALARSQQLHQQQQQQQSSGGVTTAEISASQIPNRIPASANREEIRLLDLIDRLLDDYQRRGAEPNPSRAAIRRVRERQAAWDSLASSHPLALLSRYPSLDSSNDEETHSRLVQRPSSSTSTTTTTITTNNNRDGTGRGRNQPVDRPARTRVTTPDVVARSSPHPGITPSDAALVSSRARITTTTNPNTAPSPSRARNTTASNIATSPSRAAAPKSAPKSAPTSRSALTPAPTPAPAPTTTTTPRNISTLQEFEDAAEHIERGLAAFETRESMTGYCADAYTAARHMVRLLERYFDGLGSGRGR